MRVLAVIVTRNIQDCQKTQRSLENQTVKPDIMVTVGKPVHGLVTGEIVGRTVNHALKKVNLSNYDFLLKSDDDILYPPRFLEVNTRTDYDAMGRGAGLLVRVKPFLKHVKEWDTSSLEDSYPFYALMMNGCKVLTSRWVLPAKLVKPSTEPTDFKRMWIAGRDCYRVGFPFDIYVLSKLSHIKRHRDFKAKIAQLWAILGYVYGFVFRAEKLANAEQWHLYVRKLYAHYYLHKYRDNAETSLIIVGRCLGLATFIAAKIFVLAIPYTIIKLFRRTN